MDECPNCHQEPIGALHRGIQSSKKTCVICKHEYFVVRPPGIESSAKEILEELGEE